MFNDTFMLAIYVVMARRTRVNGFCLGFRQFCITFLQYKKFTKSHSPILLDTKLPAVSCCQRTTQLNDRNRGAPEIASALLESSIFKNCWPVKLAGRIGLEAEETACDLLASKRCLRKC
jgi:hypothetical protein